MMIKLVYIGEYLNLDDYDLKYGDIYEFENGYSLYKVTQVRDGVRFYIGDYKLPIVDNIDFTTLAEWRDIQIDKILNDE